MCCDNLHCKVHIYSHIIHNTFMCIIREWINRKTPWILSLFLFLLLPRNGKVIVIQDINIFHQFMIEKKLESIRLQTMRIFIWKKKNKLIFFVCMWLDTRFHYVFYRGKNNIYFIILVYFFIFLYVISWKNWNSTYFSSNDNAFISLFSDVCINICSTKNIYIQMDVTA